jgi:hypothetical protein
MNKLPRADEAVIPIDKFVKYALDPSGDRNKAVAFESALGYNINNAEKLITQIKRTSINILLNNENRTNTGPDMKSSWI